MKIAKVKAFCEKIEKIEKNEKIALGALGEAKTAVLGGQLVAVEAAWRGGAGVVDGDFVKISILYCKRAGDLLK